MAEPAIPLSDLIDAVRSELEVAASNAQGKQLQFEVQDVKLEVDVTTTGTREAEGGVKVWVLTIGAKGSTANTATQRVTLSLTAVAPDGSRYRVSDTTAPIRRT